MHVEHLLTVQNVLGEGPMWHVGEQALYWVDIQSDCFYRYFRATGKVERFDVGIMVGTLVFRQAGGFLLATRDGFAQWDLDTQQLVFVGDPEADKATRFNDGAVDANGRFWAGTMGMQGQGAVAALYRLDPDYSLHTIETGVTVSNGTGWSPDLKTMYYTDSPTRTIFAYDFDVETGAVANKRPFAVAPEGEGFPDGLTVDSEGCIWSARWDGWRVVRYDPTGQLMETITMPVQRPTSCMFGGPSLDELYITSASVGLSEAEKARQPQAGDLFRLKTAVKGLPEPHFAG
ncbi:MAG: SMP-30/gluconolactonase/LRE family protein [Chloroflexota bacterium]